MSLGVFGAVGVFIVVFVFQLPPAAVPGSVMLIILAVITAAATMQAADGIDYMVMAAARLIRGSPRLVTTVAPLVSYVFVVGAGTSNIFYLLIPVIYEVSYASGIRPERPLSLSTVAPTDAFGAEPSEVGSGGTIPLLTTLAQVSRSRVRALGRRGRGSGVAAAVARECGMSRESGMMMP